MAPRSLSDWPTTPLGDLLRTVQSGFASGARATDGVIQVRMNNVTTDGILDWSSVLRVPATRQQVDKYALQRGDVLFNSTNSPDLVGKTTVFEGHKDPVVFSNHFLRLQVDEARLDPRYLARWLLFQWQHRTFERLCTQWVNQAAVRKEDLLALDIPLPPLPKQKRLAAILAQADRLCRLWRYVLETGDRYVEEVFLGMFGDPLKNLRGWPIVRLDSIGTLDRGRSKHRPRNAPELYGGPYPFVQTGDIANASGYIREYKQTYSELGLKQSRLWPGGTLCITIAANIARTAILTFDACFPDSVVGFVPNERTNIEFVHRWFAFVQERLELTAPESAQKNINLRILRDLEVALPPVPLQRKYSQVVRAFEHVRTRQREALRQAELLFETLLHQAFQGYSSQLRGGQDENQPG